MRYHGAKWRLAPWVIQSFPPHRFYVEPFGGAAGVLLRKPRSYAEVYNDLDGDVVNLFRVLQDPESCARLETLCALTPYAREEFRLSFQPAADPVERARRLVIRAQMGFGSGGATKGTTGFRCDISRRYTTSSHDWATYPPAVAAAGSRFAGVVIENRPALECMAEYDGPETLHFVDPPYLVGTRVLGRNGSAYRHDMDDAGHDELLTFVRGLRGMVVLCGYPSSVYRDALAGWTLRTTEARISAGRGTKVRTECLWQNPACTAGLAGLLHGAGRLGGVA